MFVGYSLEDADFSAAGERVRQVRALAESGADTPFATVLALHPDAVKQQPGFRTVAMLDAPDTRAAARRLEMFLDRISWAATREDQRSHSHLLDAHYDDLFINDPASTRLRELLAPLVRVDEDDPARKSTAWNRDEWLLNNLGARTRRSNW